MCVTERVGIHVNIRILAASEWPTLAAFLHRNNIPPALCLHSETGHSVETYRADLAALPVNEACFVAAEENAACIAVMGAEFSRESKRAWLRGPVLDSNLTEVGASDVRDALWSQLDVVLPTDIERLDGFLDVGNAACLAWYRSRGFLEQPRYFVYVAERGETGPTMPTNVRAASALQHASLLELAHVVFPSGYLTDAELTAANTEQHALFVIADGDRVNGYVYANIINAGTDEAELYVDYLVVRPDARGRTLGRALLQAALSWGFGERDVGKAALTVAADNANAQSLYASVGFVLASTGVPMRLDRNGS